MSKVLRPDERELLLSIRTTVKQAVGMRRRFRWALKKIQDLEDTEAEFACPHCQYSDLGGFRCGQCAYAGIFPDNLTSSMHCMRIKFHGVDGYDVDTVLHLSVDKIAVSVWGSDYDERRNACNFCRGHIEWANAVIKRAKDKTRRRKEKHGS